MLNKRKLPISVCPLPWKTKSLFVGESVGGESEKSGFQSLFQHDGLGANRLRSLKLHFPFYDGRMSHEKANDLPEFRKGLNGTS